MNKQVIGQYMTQKRQEQNISIQQLALLTKITSEKLEYYEAGLGLPSSQEIEAICQQLHISAWLFLNGDDQPKNDKIIIQLFCFIKEIRLLWIVLVGLFIIHGADYFQYLFTEFMNVMDVWHENFFRGLCDGTFMAIKVIGVMVFGYGIVYFIQESSKNINETNQKDI